VLDQIGLGDRVNKNSIEYQGGELASLFIPFSGGKVKAAADIGGSGVAAKTAKLWTSPDPDVGFLANAIENRYPGSVLGLNIPRAGSEIDIETVNAIIEVKGGGGKGLGKQITDRLSGPLNPTGKPVIGYARNLGPFAAREINRRGGIAAGGAASTLDTLLDILAP
jgi:hypothetical protein